ncbi:DMT family transporter [Roseospira marina]|uniref:DMT family transporter n=1 Tax=Roseospira marina TaxID=140057 RepID=A0A5M6ICP2_9PROT|nr:DMT family transporter [Roseospira marina]KAA5605747.1 DMT family transporter [Roseospira marina]MBB4313550.1 drug/metabolite transporter (DMT)-like permease [Roseospira marina]MBB5086712.1 drug/metabolite transporter (DMT)-like permease [Roseospira marina]
MRRGGHASGWGPLARIGEWPYLLLFLTISFWSGNAIVGRAVSGHVPPIGMAFWRWTLAGLIVLAFAWPKVREEWPIVRRHWRIVVLLSILGITIFNTFLYIGLQDTQAINALLMQTAMPVLIILWGFALFRERVTRLQMAGLLVSLSGAAAVISRGDPMALLALEWNVGDVWVLGAVGCYAGYTTLLRLRPPISASVFLAVSFLTGATFLVPLYLWEMLVGGRTLPLDMTTFGAIGYVTLFPSILAYACFNRGVAMVGANVAGQFMYLLPLVGGLMSVAFLGERLLWTHGLGLALIVSGLWLAARGQKRKGGG